jgi:hypothetical protein
VIKQQIEHHCSNCATVLAGMPEYEHSEWFLRCRACGAKNLLALTLTIIGYRRLQKGASFESQLSRVEPTASLNTGRGADVEP